MRVAGWCLVLGLTMGCSALVAGDPPTMLACQDGLEFDPCRNLEPRMQCVAAETGGVGTCQPCGAVEFCNQIDDDCDDRVDEGLDVDGDGVSGCGGPDDRVDCDDNNANVFPRDTDFDPCDGVDNDCDPTTVDGLDCEAGVDLVCNPSVGCVPATCETAGCPDGEFCDRSLVPVGCTPLDDSCFTVPCEGDTRCNPLTGICVTPQPNGSLCDGSAECESELCIPSASIRAGSLLGGRRGVCGETCCDDASCGANAFCWASGSGLSACVPNALLADSPLPVPADPHCSSRARCGSGLDCVLDLDNALTVEDRAATACRPPPTARRTCTGPGMCPSGACLDGVCLGLCLTRADCASGICLGDEPQSGRCLFGRQECLSNFDCDAPDPCLGADAGTCSDTCGSRDDCPVSLDGGTLDRPSCIFVEGRVIESGRTDVFPVCLYGSTDSTQGEACTVNNDCRDRTCVGPEGETDGEGRFCADTCCNNDDCGADEQCRPVEIRGHWETHCLPRPSFPILGDRP